MMHFNDYLDIHGMKTICNESIDRQTHNPLYVEMMNIFGSKKIATRIITRPLLHDLTTRYPPKQEKDPAALLTTKIIVISKGKDGTTKICNTNKHHVIHHCSIKPI